MEFTEEDIDGELGDFKRQETSYMQLMKILKSSAKKFNGALRQSCISLYKDLLNVEPACFAILIQNESLAFKVYGLLKVLEKESCKNGFHVGALNIIGPLLDKIEDTYQIEDDSDLESSINEAQSKHFQTSGDGRVIWSTIGSKVQTDDRRGPTGVGDVLKSMSGSEVSTMELRAFQADRPQLGQSPPCPGTENESKFVGSEQSNNN